MTHTQTVCQDYEKSLPFVNPFTGIPGIPVKLNSRRIEYSGK